MNEQHTIDWTMLNCTRVGSPYHFDVFEMCFHVCQNIYSVDFITLTHFFCGGKQLATILSRLFG